MATITEDYKEKLKEALNSDNTDYEVVRWIEQNFPELKESENERMVKFIKKQLFNIKKTITENYELDAKLTKAIDWLEKQGNLMKALQISNAKIGELIEKNYYLKEQLEKQGKNNMGISEAIKQKLEDNLNKALEKETPESWDKFLDGQGVQKPWSEEDEDILNTIINHFKVDIECTDDDDIIKWLKSLKERVQPKREWSKEDKEMLNLIIARLHSHPNVDSEEYSKEYHWLNKEYDSLFPQNTWMPSELQIEALDFAANYTAEFCFNRKALKELLEQLKKLREELYGIQNRRHSNAHGRGQKTTQDCGYNRPLPS